MLIARPELFIQTNSREQWLNTLQNKIQSSKETLTYLVQNETDKTAKIARKKLKLNF